MSKKLILEVNDVSIALATYGAVSPGQVRSCPPLARPAVRLSGRRRKSSATHSGVPGNQFTVNATHVLYPAMPQ